MRARWSSAVVLMIAVSGGAPVPVADCPAADPVGWYERNVDAATLTWEWFAAYAPDERTIILRYVGADLRTDLRRSHLLRMAADPRFTAEQQGIIRRVRAYYGGYAPISTAAALRDLDEAVAQHFSREEAWAAFKVIGPAVAPAPVDGDASESRWCNCRSIAECVTENDLSGRCSNPWCIWNISCGPVDNFWCLRKCI